MNLPADAFANAISIGKVYYFSSEKLNTAVPHYFICVAKEDGGLLILVCSTSQFEKRKKFIETRGFPESTLVWIEPNEENGFTIDSFIDCNSYFDYTIEEFKKLYSEGKLEYKGQISSIHLEQISLGVKDSPLVEEEIKEIVEKHIEDTL